MAAAKKSKENFYRQLIDGAESQLMSADGEQKLEFALTEIFNFYTRKYQEKYDTFENNKETLYRLGLRGYVAFVKDMKILVDKQRVIEVWKKAAVNQQPHLFDEFRGSL